MKTKLFFISLLAILSLASCSNFVESLQKNKPTGAEQQGQQNGQDQSQKPQVQPEVFYNITFADFENGGISSSKTTGIKAGEEIILSVEAEKGYVFKSLIVYNAQNKDVAIAQIVAGSSYKFTMPNSDVTVKVVFEAKPQEQTQQTTPDEQTQQPDNIEQSQQTGTEQQTQQTTPDDTTSQQTNPDESTTQPPVPTGPVRYRVEHYQQDVDGSDTYELYAIQEKRGEAGSDTDASAKTYTGFTAQAFTQPKIAADGSTIVRIYYNRNTITYTFNPNGGNWDGSTDVVKVSGLFGGELEKPLNPARPGYTFDEWNKIIPVVFGSEDELYTVRWIPNTDTPYTVRVYSQTAEGSYILDEVLERTGTTDTNTNYSAPSKDRYILPTINQVNINGDGSTILNVYYNRVTYTVNFDTMGGSTIPSQQVLYQAKVQLPQEPTKAGYSFYRWYTDQNCKYLFKDDSEITSNITLYAFWNDNSITYKFHETVERLEPGTNGTYGTSGEYVLFGDYPQSLKGSTINVDESKIMKMGDLILYGGSDGNLYYKVDNGTTVRYYKVDPIKWRIISRGEDNTVVLLSEKILINSSYGSSQFSPSNPYISINDYFNDFIFQRAFTSKAQKIFKSKSNPELIISYEPNVSGVELSQDYVYLLNVLDFFNAFPDYYEGLSSYDLTIRECTPFSMTNIDNIDRITGLVYTPISFDDYSGPGNWWLFADTIDCDFGSGLSIVGSDGVLYRSCHGYWEDCGIVPAITVQLSE